MNNSLAPSTSSNSFQTRYGPWALVAGASEGLGAAWAEALAARGLNLILVARRAEALEETAKAIRSRHSVDIVPVALDLSHPELLKSLAPTLSTREVGLYVHNAASTAQGDFLSRPLDDQLRSLDVNCRASLTLAHHFASAMASRGRGGIILMASLTAFQGTPHIATYGATKAFNLVLAEGLNAELRGRGVDVMACCAGATRTPGFLKSSPNGEPGQMEPAQVVEEALEALGTGAMMIPGRFNRFASFFMQRILPRTLAIRILESRTKNLRVSA